MSEEVPPDVIKQMVPLRKAARLARTRYERVKSLVDGGHLAAYSDGRSIRVRPGDIGPAMLKVSRHAPAAARPPRKTAANGPLKNLAALGINY